MKKPLTAVLLTAAVVATLAVPAGAAPSKSRRITTPCNGGDPKVQDPGQATVIWGKTMTVRNPCSHWLFIYWGQTNSGSAYFVRPGVYARVPALAPELKPDSVFVDTRWSRKNTPCTDGNDSWSTTLVYSSKHVGGSMPPCH